MSNWSLQVHPDVDKRLETLDPSIQDQVRKKIIWAQVQLAMRGRTLRVKGTAGHRCSWKRTPVRGMEYYLWWIQGAESGTDGLALVTDDPTVFIRNLRHHDETDQDLDPGEPEDYQSIGISSLDPRYEQQHRVVANLNLRGKVNVRVVEGYPGSGKTVALLYAVRDLAPLQKILYVTYTNRLADEAATFFDTYGIGAGVRVRTLYQLFDDIIGDTTGKRSTVDAESAYREFVDYVSRLPPTVSGPWRGSEQALWAEVRAYLVGMALPITWRRGDIQIEPCDVLGIDQYRLVRQLGDSAVDKAYHIAELAIRNNFIEEQRRARLALETLLASETDDVPMWLGGLGGVVVDEIQDLTPIQIALLTQVARTAASARDDKNHRPFVFMAAGDESQTVQPSGFEWGKAKDLLYQQLEGKPVVVELPYQLRTPQRLAELLDNTWDLYRERYRFAPREGSRLIIPDEGHAGELLRCRIDSGWKWKTLLEQLAEDPGRALVNLHSTDSSDELPDVPEARQVVFTPQQIKGLDRRTVVVWGLDQALEVLDRLTDRYATEVTLLQARHLVDSIRVALSRSTETLVILEQNGSERLAPLNIDRIDGVREVDWDGLISFLEQQELTYEERILGFLDDAKDSFHMGHLERALSLNDRSLDLASRADDARLTRSVHQQRDNFLAQQHLNEIDELLGEKLNREAYIAYREGETLLSKVTLATLKQDWTTTWSRLESDIDAIAEDCWRLAIQTVGEEQWSAAAHEFRIAEDIQSEQGKKEAASAFACLAERYEVVPPDVRPGTSQVPTLLDLLRRYNLVLEKTGAAANKQARGFAAQWAREALDALHEHPKLFMPWGILARQVAKWEAHDLVVAFPDFKGKASDAATQLRQDGDLRAAHELLTFSGNPVVKELESAVRMLDAIHTFSRDHLETDLYPAEYTALAVRLESQAKTLRRKIPEAKDRETT